MIFIRKFTYTSNLKVFLQSSLGLTLVKNSYKSAICKGSNISLRPFSTSHNKLSYRKESDQEYGPVYDETFDIDDETVYNREFAEMKLEDFESIFKDDDTIKEQIETVLKEYEYHKYNSMGRVPSVIDKADMDRFIREGQTPTARDKMFSFLFKREMSKRSYQRKKAKEREEKRVIRQQKFDDMSVRYGGVRTGLLTSDGDLVYGLWHNSLFCRIAENKMKLGSSRSRLIQSALFGKKLIFDFDFNDYMVPYVLRNTCDQIQESYGMNRFNGYQEPFDLWLCNLKRGSEAEEYMSDKILKNLHDGSMITVKEDCFTNYFDKSKLVYLTPNARERVKDIWNDDYTYIIGAYNDKGTSKPLTYRKAQALGIKAQSLPIDNYIAWQGGSKSLCINHVVGILLEVIATSGDWRAAFEKYIPSRKVKSLDVLLELEEQRRAKYKYKRNLRTFNIREDLD